ncbi:MAG TPA: AAA family ATPase [Blastocatellia bacterium]|nr:AAA family ATPase [Blastocatellia bacterium]
MLEERFVAELKALHSKLDAEGVLLSQSALDACYDRFKRRFGPDVLKNLDGEDLLKLMHDHSNRNSLVYWLEFKDDDELPAKFGSIAGGSALKFGIFRRRETGAWTGRDASNYPVEISLEEAIAIARRHRDQLVAGCELLDKFPDNGTDDDYKALQEQMDSLAPDVSRLTWGHKYFCLIYPAKIDAFHAISYQLFNLVKLLQLPPEGKGRYLAAGRYVSIADKLGIHIKNLTTVLVHRNGNPYYYWRVGTSDSTQPRNRWEIMRDGNSVAIGWPEIGDLTGIAGESGFKDSLRELMETHYPNAPQAVTRAANQVLALIKRIARNDLVLASDGASVLGIGKVVGEYYFDSSSDFPHRLPVEWLSLEEWRLPNAEGLRTTVHLIKEAINMLEVERRILEAPARAAAVAPRNRESSHPPRLGGLPGRIQDVLERKGQVILYGPPGTGKTHWAETAARELAALSSCGVTFGELSDDQRAVVLGDGSDSLGLVRMCCFHPAYGYEDFLEGYRPETSDGRMTFLLRDGIFKRLCADASAQPEKKFYLIIDEINRGDIPRIFGELLTVIEKDKRGKSILLPLTATPFQIPGNVYIIGTMNTADRSIALLDTALRRRFGFIELMPDSSIFKGAVVGGIPLGPWLDALNARIRDHIGRDARNLQIGHSYLLEGSHPVSDFSKLSRAIREDIIPLLEEYCYEDFATLEKIIGRGLVDAASQSIRHELFGDSMQGELVQALLAPFPEIATSMQALTSTAEALGDDGEGEETGEPADKE